MPKIDLVVPLVTKDFVGSGELHDEILRAKYNGLAINSITYDVNFLPECLVFSPFHPLGNLNHFSAKGFLSNITYRFSRANKMKEYRSSKDSLKRFTKDLTPIKSAFEAGTLTLVCGAGVSRSSGLPLWKTLLGRLYHLYKDRYSESFEFDDFKLERLVTSYSSLYLGKCLKDELGDEFPDRLHKSLYYCYSDTFTQTPLISSIVKLCNKDRGGKSLLDSIITFNYDSLIENALLSENIRNTPIYDDGIICEKNHLPIYHIHGYMPLTGDVDHCNLVFSEDEYHALYNDPYSWANQIQVQKLRHNSCLFIGVSLEDPNFRRLLYTVQTKRQHRYNPPQHFLFRTRPHKKDEHEGVAIQFMENDARKFGINTIWVSNYDEIPYLLEELIK